MPKIHDICQLFIEELLMEIPQKKPEILWQILHEVIFADLKTRRTDGLILIEHIYVVIKERDHYHPLLPGTPPIEPGYLALKDYALDLCESYFP